MEVAALYQVKNSITRKIFKHSLENIQEVLMVFLVHASQRHSIDPMEKRLAWNQQVASRKEDLDLVKEYPSAKNYLPLTRVMKSKNHPQSRTYCKGAPEAIFQLCHFSEEENARYTQLVESIGEWFTEFFAAAHCEINSTELPENKKNFLLF